MASFAESYICNRPQEAYEYILSGVIITRLVLRRKDKSEWILEVSYRFYLFFSE